MLREYPNPGAVPYATTRPPPFPCQLTSNDEGKLYPMHQHEAWMNPSGEGNTGTDASHFHRIRDFRVLPDPSDGHTHALTMLPCGVGQPVNVARFGPPSSMTTLPASDAAAVSVLRGVSMPSAKWLWIGFGALLLTGAVVGAAVYFHERREEE